jgi:3-deoxy-D-manno-octulosonic acid kinase
MTAMKFGRVELPGGAILHDVSLSRDPSALFDRDALRMRAALADARGGRGSISYIEVDGQQFVLRRYLRGGLPARVSRDCYFWLGEERTRPFHEFRLLAALMDRGLPVPRPVAARYLRSGLTYRGELVTERLRGATSLAERWLAGRIRDADWQSAGRCIRRFHDAGVQHADLNANNVMLDDAGNAWLLDFDRGQIRTPGDWQERSLARLGRSLKKIARAAGLEDWRAGFDILRTAHDADGS